MTPREIDKLVAEKVFGYTVLPQSRLRHYSTAIAAAWQVLEKMEQVGWHWRFFTPFEDGDTYGAGLTPKGVSGWNGRSDVFADALTMPMAICIAALKAVGVDLSSA